MRLIYSLLLVCLSSSLIAQTQISGTVNDYQAVAVIDPVFQWVRVSDASAFSPGDVVMLIQMQGATIDETLSDNFGTIQNYNGAGSYEIHRICTVQGTQVSFHDSIKANFDASGSVQLIRIPEYMQGAQLTGDLTGSSWNGGVGGVIAIRVAGTLDLNGQNIDASGIGFRGGEALPSGGGCLPVSLSIQYTDKNSTNDRALKGEGIAAYISGKECSRGPQANGGGGGNNHNGGGSGGGNYGIGGSGGQRIKYSSLACGSVVGLDSKSLASAYSNEQLFMGGGGGAGHGNNAGLTGESGQNGGGIVFIMADAILSNGDKILANGNDATQNAESEGAGGGGAGGSIVLDVPNAQISGNLNLQAIGGAGGGVENVSNQNCSGPGGGGGGGFIAHASGSLPSAVSAIVNGGISGTTVVATQTGCPVGGTNGAKDGGDGTVISWTSLPLYIDTPAQITRVDTACNQYQSPSGKHIWTSSGNYVDTASGVSGCNAIYSIQLTIENIDTTVTQHPTTLEANASGLNYQWIDCATLQPLLGETAKILAPPYNGSFAVVLSNSNCSDTSGCFSVENVGIDFFKLENQITVYPNPSDGEFIIDFPLEENWKYRLFNAQGKLILEGSVQMLSQSNFSLSSPGFYRLEVELEGQYWQQSIVVQP